MITYSAFVHVHDDDRIEMHVGKEGDPVLTIGDVTVFLTWNSLKALKLLVDETT